MKSISLVASMAVVLGVGVAGACSSKDKAADAAGGSVGTAGNGNAGSPESTGGTAATPGTNGGQAGTTTGGTPSETAGAGGASGNLPRAPEPILCPEKNAISPKNKNSVAVQGVVLMEDEHWTSDKVYLIGDDFKVENHTLTVDPGTVICLYNDAQLIVGEGIDPGEIHLDGTPDKHITITAVPSADDATKPDSFIRGLKMDTFMKSTLSYVDIWYSGPGGGRGAWAFELDDTAQGTKKTDALLVDHLYIGQVQSKGFRVGTPNGLAKGSAIRFTGYAEHAAGDPDLDYAAGVNFYAAMSVNDALTYDKANIPAASQAVHVETAAPPIYLEHDVELPDIGLPYWYTDMNLILSGPDDGTKATLTLDPGVTLHVTGQLRVGDKHEGNLVAVGSAEKPVVITSAQATPASGDWEGIAFLGSFFDPKVSTIDHAQILYAGMDVLDSSLHVGRCGDDFSGAVEIFGEGSYEGPTISNTLIAHSLSNGLVAEASNTNTTLATDYSKAALKVTFDDIALEKLVVDACP